MRYQRVKVQRDTNTVYNRPVPPWEIPILEFIFEEGNVTRLDSFETNDFQYPDPAVEFDRLARAYGADPKSGVLYVASVYGDSVRGVRELRTAIKEAQAAEAAATPRSARRQSKAADPLMA